MWWVVGDGSRISWVALLTARFAWVMQHLELLLPTIRLKYIINLKMNGKSMDLSY